jgi:hypothetical protein
MSDALLPRGFAILCVTLALGACFPMSNPGSSDGDDDDDDDDIPSGSSSGWGASVDHDGDGSMAGEDCDDGDPSVFPGAYESCNQRDDDCDDEVDEGLETYQVWRDADGDGWGDNDNSLQACNVPSGYVWYGGDCDDENEDVNPAAEETCDGADNDCDGRIDRRNAYTDADGDGHAGTATNWDLCDDPPVGAALVSTDCDDANDAVHPDADEVCGDAIDNDCSGHRTCIEQTWSYGETHCVETWQGAYLESWDEVCVGCEFWGYGQFSASTSWEAVSGCNYPYDNWLEFMFEADAIHLYSGFDDAASMGEAWEGTWDGSLFTFVGPEIIYESSTPYIQQWSGEIDLSEIQEIVDG